MKLYHRLTRLMLITNNKLKNHVQISLKGIVAGKMDYANDPILPYVTATIQKIVDKFSNISLKNRKILSNFQKNN